MSDDLAGVLQRVGAQFLVRGWLSANNIVFSTSASTPAVMVDTGYFSHADQTLRLLERALGGRTLDGIINTHLHSDHCGGNRAVQDRYPGSTIATPIGFQPAVSPWDESKLSFEDTGQHCPSFRVDHFVVPGDEIRLGQRTWQVHSAPGHDPEALMFFEPMDRLLISGDALWERRLAIIFPELAGEEGFHTARRTLDAIERLAPRWVLPGHGNAFSDAPAAISRSRERLDSFKAQPDRHRQHAARALAMFHMLEHHTLSSQELERWMVNTPIFGRALAERTPPTHQESGEAPNPALRDAARDVIASLVADGALLLAQGELRLNAAE